MNKEHALYETLKDYADYEVPSTAPFASALKYELPNGIAISIIPCQSHDGCWEVMGIGEVEAGLDPDEVKCLMRLAMIVPNAQKYLETATSQVHGKYGRGDEADAWADTANILAAECERLAKLVYEYGGYYEHMHGYQGEAIDELDKFLHKDKS